MGVFDFNMQRRIRLRHATAFDLEPFIGENVTLYVGEVPQSKQDQLLKLLEVRGELRAAMAEQELKANAAKAEGRELSPEELEVDPALAEQASRAQRELLSAALLNDKGDPLDAADVRTLFDLLPMTAEASKLVNDMLNALLENLGKSAKAKPGDSTIEGEAAPVAPVK